MADKSQWPDSIDQWSGLKAHWLQRTLSFSLFSVELYCSLFNNNVIRWNDSMCIFSSINCDSHQMQVQPKRSGWINTFPLYTTKVSPLRLYSVWLAGCAEIGRSKTVLTREMEHCELVRGKSSQMALHSIEHSNTIVCGYFQNSILRFCFIVVYFWSLYVWQVHTFHGKMNPN